MDIWSKKGITSSYLNFFLHTLDVIDLSYNHVVVSLNFMSVELLNSYCLKYLVVKYM